MKKVNNVFKSDELFPLYARFGIGGDCQAAYIELHIGNGTLTAEYNSDVNNALPVDVWNGVCVRWPISSMFTNEELTDILNENISYFQSVLDRASVDYIDGDWMGVIDNFDPMERQRFADLAPRGGIIGGLKDWLNGEIFPGEGQSPRDFIDAIYDLDGQDGLYLQARKSTMMEVYKLVMDLWANELYIGSKLPRAVATCLLIDGRCNDSQWTAELAQYASQ